MYLQLKEFVDLTEDDLVLTLCEMSTAELWHLQSQNPYTDDEEQVRECVQQELWARENESFEQRDDELPF